MRTFLKLPATVLAISAILWMIGPGTARAGNPHFVGNVKVDVNTAAETVTVSGKIAGLGNGDVKITCDVDGSCDIFLVSPGGNEAPGQNKAPFASVASGIFRPDAKNGNVVFTLVVDLGPAIDAAAAAVQAPNPNWTKVVRNVAVEGGTLTVEQPAGNVVLTHTF